MSRERLVFDPKREEGFLRGLRQEVRESVLRREVGTAAYEAEFLPAYTREYKLVGERVFDAESGLFVADLTARGKRPEEVEAMERIEEGLRQRKTVVNFSPKIDVYGYDQNCVDFWRVEGEDIRWARIVVKNGFSELKEVWKNLGGQGEVGNELDLLARPVKTEMRMAEVIQMLDLMAWTSRHSKEEIDRVVERMSAIFFREFGLERMMEPEIIFRLWSAVTAELDRAENQWSVLTRGLGIRNYLYGEMRQVIRPSGGCAGLNMVGEFRGGQGYYVINSVSGLRVMKGVIPEGYRYCQKCGVWYRGEKCPFCG